MTSAQPGGLLDHLNAEAEADLDEPLAFVDQLEDIDEPPARRQPGELVEVILAGVAEPLTVRILNADRIRYEKTAARHSEWPTQGRSFLMTFLTWAAAKRTGQTELTHAQWEQAVEDWDVIREVPADPTR